MGKVFWEGSALLAPVPPALVTCGTMEEPNVLTIAWTGIICTRPAMTYISVRPSRYSYGLIRQTGEFAINLTPSRLVKAADFLRSTQRCPGGQVCAVRSASAAGTEDLCAHSGGMSGGAGVPGDGKPSAGNPRAVSGRDSGGGRG